MTKVATSKERVNRCFLVPPQIVTRLSVRYCVLLIMFILKCWVSFHFNQFYLNKCHLTFIINMKYATSTRMCAFEFCQSKRQPHTPRKAKILILFV